MQEPPAFLVGLTFVCSLPVLFNPSFWCGRDRRVLAKHLTLPACAWTSQGATQIGSAFKLYCCLNMGSGQVTRTLEPPRFLLTMTGSAHPPHRSTGVLVQTNTSTITALRGLETKTLWSSVLLEVQDLKSFLGDASDSGVLCQGTERALTRFLLRSSHGGGRAIEPVGRVPDPTSFITLPILHPGAFSEDLIGTKWKPFIWSNVPTL